MPVAIPTLDEIRQAVREEIRAALSKREPTMLTVQAAAQVAGVSAATIRRRIRSGEIVPVRLGARTVRIPRDAVTRLGGRVVEEAHEARFPHRPGPRRGGAGGPQEP